MRFSRWTSTQCGQGRIKKKNLKQAAIGTDKYYLAHRPYMLCGHTGLQLLETRISKLSGEGLSQSHITFYSPQRSQPASQTSPTCAMDTLPILSSR